MKRIASLTVILLLPAIVYAQASISFDMESINVGEVVSGHPIEHVFVVKNTGDEDLLIEKIVPS